MQRHNPSLPFSFVRDGFVQIFSASPKHPLIFLVNIYERKGGVPSVNTELRIYLIIS